MRYVDEAPYFTVAELSDHLSLSKATILRRIQAGDLHSILLGSRRLVSYDEAMSYKAFLAGVNAVDAKCQSD